MIAFLQNTWTITEQCYGDRCVWSPVHRRTLQAQIWAAALWRVIWSSFYCYCWLSQAFLIKVRVCAGVCGDWRGQCVQTHTEYPVCLYTMWLCESLAVRWRERCGCHERQRERGVFGVFSFSTISFQPAARFVPVLTSIVPSVSFHNPLY